MSKLMTTNHDCGPTAIYNAINTLYNDKFHLTYEDFLRLWKFPNKNNFIDDLRDHPGDHIAILNKLGIPFKRIKSKDFIKNIDLLSRSKTIILIHDIKNPFLKQHWVRFLYYWQDKNKDKGMFAIDYGYGIFCIETNDFYDRVKAGFPEFVYILGEKENSKMFKFTNYMWLTLRFFMIILTKILGLFV